MPSSFELFVYGVLVILLGQFLKLPASTMMWMWLIAIGCWVYALWGGFSPSEKTEMKRTIGQKVVQPKGQTKEKEDMDVMLGVMTKTIKENQQSMLNDFTRILESKPPQTVTVYSDSQGHNPNREYAMARKKTVKRKASSTKRRSKQSKKSYKKRTMHARTKSKKSWIDRFISKVMGVLGIRKR